MCTRIQIKRNGDRTEMLDTNELGLELNGVLSGHDLLKIGPRASTRLEGLPDSFHVQFRAQRINRSFLVIHNIQIFYGTEYYLVTFQMNTVIGKHVA